MQKKTRLWLLRVFNNLMPVASIKAPIEFNFKPGAVGSGRMQGVGCWFLSGIKKS
jgi:hypothetical protein